MKWLLLFLATAVAFAQQQQADKNRPLVLISGNGNVAFVAGAASKHDQTIEMAEQLMKHCPEVTLTVSETDKKADYDLVLNRETIGLFNEGESQIMLVRGSDKTVMNAIKKGTVAKAVKEGCRLILADWKNQHPSPSGDWWQPSKSK